MRLVFEPTDHPRLFGLPPGVDFPQALIQGLHQRLNGSQPEALAQVHLIVNTRRMARRIRTLFDQGPAVLLPKTSLVTDLSHSFALFDVPNSVSSLRRRLELTQLITRLLDQQPGIAPRGALFDLADSLASLMDEMHGEGVTPDVIEALDVADQSGHWAHILEFLNIVKQVFANGTEAPDSEERQRLLVKRLVAKWDAEPPQTPVILAGSTGSRGTTLMLMEAVAKLPQGAVVLPGFDFEMKADQWAALLASDEGALPVEDHPQFRFHRIMAQLDLDFKQVEVWHDTPPPDLARNQLISLALRPVPVTDQWLRDGPDLGDLHAVTKHVTLLEAPSSRLEALTIAMRLRQAAEDGQTAALITPDRTLTRQVTAALDRWDIIPDDSAGRPLHLSPPGRFLRHVGDLMRQRLTAEHLLTLLKHPLAHSGGHRGAHLRLSRELELYIRKTGLPFPQADDLQSWVETQKDAFAGPWVAWLCDNLLGQHRTDAESLTDQVARHLSLAENIADGSAPEKQSELWKDSAGREARTVTLSLIEQALYGGQIDPFDYTTLFHSLLAGEEVRNPDTPHPKILIWGTLEARVQGADLVILAGLNEGSWPSAPTPDPWLNRALRHQAGLLLPERRIGLSAHDFQQAVAAKEVWLSRSVRSDDAETVASRWLNRMTNLIAGLPDQGGKEALKTMQDRGAHWMLLAAALEKSPALDPAPRPAPCPPVDVRPRQMSVTEIKRLIRDPYAIYAKHVLRLRPINPLMRAPDALLRGIVLHDVLEEFVQDSKNDPAMCATEVLMDKAISILSDQVPWAETRATWLARLERVAHWSVETEHARRALAHPTEFEASGSTQIPELAFTLTAKADRIDVDADGGLHIYDYKTGTPPSKSEQTYFDKQLLLEAVIAERSGFRNFKPAPVMKAQFIGLGSKPGEVNAPLDDEPPTKVWAEFEELIRAYLNPATGYTARRAPQSKDDNFEYDHLSRFGEWDITAEPDKGVLG